MPRFNFRLFSRGASSKQHIGCGDGPSKVDSVTMLDETAELNQKLTEMLDELKDILVESHQNGSNIKTLENSFEQFVVTDSSTSEVQNQLDKIIEIKGGLLKLKSEAHEKGIEINEHKKLNPHEKISNARSFEDVKKFWENIK